MAAAVAADMEFQGAAGDTVVVGDMAALHHSLAVLVLCLICSVDYARQPW